MQLSKCSRRICCFLAAYVLTATAVMAYVVTIDHIFKDDNVLLLKSDVVLVAAFDSSTSKVIVSPEIGNDDLVAIEFYQGPCSKIKLFPQVRNYTKQINFTKNSQHRIDKPYLLRDSLVNYTITVAGTASILCVARIHLSINHPTNTSGSLGCVSRAVPLNLLLTDFQNNSYDLVGLYSGSVNITVHSAILEYNISDLSTTLCNFSKSARKCTIPLHHHGSRDQETCVLASLQDTATSISLGYAVSPSKHNLKKDVWYSIIDYFYTLLLFMFLPHRQVRKGSWLRLRSSPSKCSHN